MKAAATKDTLITLQVDAWLLLEADQRSHSAGRTDDEHSRRRTDQTNRASNKLAAQPKAEWMHLVRECDT